MLINKINFEFYQKGKEVKASNKINSIEEINHETNFLLRVPTKDNVFYIGDLFYHKEKNAYILMSFEGSEQTKENDIAIHSFGFYLFSKSIYNNEWDFHYYNIANIENYIKDIDYKGNIYNMELEKVKDTLSENVDKTYAVYEFLENTLVDSPLNFIYKVNRKLMLNYLVPDKNSFIIEGINNIDKLSIEKLFKINEYNQYSFLLHYIPNFHSKVYVGVYDDFNKYLTNNGVGDIKEKIWSGTLFLLDENNKDVQNVLKMLKDLKSNGFKDTTQLRKNNSKIFCVFNNYTGNNELLNPDNLNLYYYYILLDLKNERNYFKEIRQNIIDESTIDIYQKEFLKII